jgi:hypothetical protein
MPALRFRQFLSLSWRFSIHKTDQTLVRIFPWILQGADLPKLLGQHLKISVELFSALFSPFKSINLKFVFKKLCYVQFLSDFSTNFNIHKMRKICIGIRSSTENRFYWTRMAFK